MNKNRDSKKKKQAHKHYSSLASHKRTGKTLSSPLSELGMTHTSWMNERLPEMLWASLLLEGLHRPKALGLFRQVILWLKNLPTQDSPIPLDVTHSALAAMPAPMRSELLTLLCDDIAVRVALRPLLLIKDLPGAVEWSGALRQEVHSDDWTMLTKAVGKTLDHQGEYSTDCRWLRVMVLMSQGKLILPTQMSSRFDELVGYPDVGELESVRPFIRSAELMIDMTSGGRTPAAPWLDSFWRQCLHETPCLPMSDVPMDTHIIQGTSRTSLEKTRRALLEHEAGTLTTSAIDPRRETVFGLAFYALGLLEELLCLGNAESVLGRIGLRTLAELNLTLGYLVTKDEATLWSQFRRYGTGQAKLNFLKLTEDPPAYVRPEVLEHLANEDLWQEFVDIQLGSWAGSDLRKMSEDAGLKGVYDTYYGWPSTYVHGHWPAVRDTCYQTCLNPLHRLHRRPRPTPKALPDVVSDATQIVDAILAFVDRAYPTFIARLSTTP